MATVRQAVERLRESGALAPAPVISLRDLHRRFPANPRGSARALLSTMFGKASKKLPWAVILCRFKNEAPNASLEGPVERLYRGMFAPGTGGLVEYWRDVSLGAIEIAGSRVLGWYEIDIPRAQAGIGSGAGRSTLVDAAIRAAQKNNVDPVTGFHSQIAVYVHNWSKDGAPAGADWRTPAWSAFWIDGSADGRGKVTLTPPHDGNISAHEMGHGFDMHHDVSADFQTHYADPCCIMSQANAFLSPVWNVSFGPAVCLPHLVQRDWMYKRRTYRDNGTWLSNAAGITLPLAQLTDPGARANLGIILPFKNGQTSWDYYLEYARPTGWTQGLSGDIVFIRRMAPGKDVGATPAILGSIGVPAAVGAKAQFTEPSGNVSFQVERTDAEGRILRITATKR